MSSGAPGGEVGVSQNVSTLSTLSCTRSAPCPPCLVQGRCATFKVAPRTAGRLCLPARARRPLPRRGADGARGDRPRGAAPRRPGGPRDAPRRGAQVGGAPEWRESGAAEGRNSKWRSESMRYFQSGTQCGRGHFGARPAREKYLAKFWRKGFRKLVDIVFKTIIPEENAGNILRISREFS